MFKLFDIFKNNGLGGFSGNVLKPLVSPVYLMTEPLIDRYKLKDSANSRSTYNGLLKYVGDGTEPADEPYYPTIAEYPQDGTIDLTENGNGKGTKYIDHVWIAPADEEWTIQGKYNLNDAYTIHYKGNYTCDIYLSVDGGAFVLSESDKAYTPPVDSWKTYSVPPEIVVSNLLNDVPPTLYNPQGNTISPAFTSDTNNAFSFGIIEPMGASAIYPRVNTNFKSAPAIGTTLVVELDVVVNSGTPFLRRIYFGDSSLLTGEALITGTYIYEYTIVTDTFNAISLAFNGVDLAYVCDFEVTRYEVKEKQ